MREEASPGWFMATRGELVGGGQWSHQYGGADNSSCSQDALVHGELGQVISGEVSGRDSEDEITLFKSVGNAIQDLALAIMIMKKINHDRS